LELSLCSICLDDYEAGDKLRVLHCNHAFHGKVRSSGWSSVANGMRLPFMCLTCSLCTSFFQCIGKWLVERSATCPLCKTELWDGDQEEEDDEEGESNARQGAATTAPLIPPHDYGANSWDRAWHRFFTNDAYQYLPQQQQPQAQPQGQPQTTNALPPAEQPPVISFGGPSVPMGSSAEADIAPTAPSLWRRMLSTSRRRLARRVHMMSVSSSTSGSDHGATTSAMLAEPLLAHSSERDVGSELRTLSPRRPDPSSPSPSDDEARRIQPSAEAGRRDDPLATAPEAAACESSPAVPPVSSSPPRQVSV
jgi:RING-like zinc finger